MNTREDIHRELFGRLAAEERGNPHRPALDTKAVNELYEAARNCMFHTYDVAKNSTTANIRHNALNAAVAALRVVYSIDDALS